MSCLRSPLVANRHRVTDRACQVVLEDVRWDALKAVVDFAYTGSVVLAGSTVVAIIQAANLLQVEAVEHLQIRVTLVMEIIQLLRVI